MPVCWWASLKIHLAALFIVLIACSASLARGQSSSTPTPMSNASESELLKPYHLVKTIPLPFLKKMSGQLGFDQENNRLFFSDGKDLVVINADNGERVGLVPKIEKVSDIAFAPDIHRAFIVDSDSRALFALELSTLTLVQKTNAGAESLSVLYDAESKEVFTTGRTTSTCKVFAPATGKQIAAVKLGGYPLHAVGDSHGNIYFELTSSNSGPPVMEMAGDAYPIAISLKSAIAKLDTRTLVMGDRWQEPACAFMHLLGVDRSGENLLIGCKDSAILADPQTGRVVAFTNISGIRDGMPVTFSPALGDAFLLGLDEQPSVHRTDLAIIHEDSSGHLGPVVLAPQVWAQPEAFDSATQQFFAVQSDTKTVDSGLFIEALGTRSPVPVQQPIPGTFRILVYSRN